MHPADVGAERIRRAQSGLGLSLPVSVERDDESAALPGDPIQIEDRSFDIQPLAIGRRGFADRAAPIEHTRNADGHKVRGSVSIPVGEPPESECFEFAFGDDQG